MNIWVAQAAAGVYYLLVGACDMRLASRMQADDDDDDDADDDDDDDDRPRPDSVKKIST